MGGDSTNAWGSYAVNTGGYGSASALIPDFAWSLLSGNYENGPYASIHNTAVFATGHGRSVGDFIAIGNQVVNVVNIIDANSFDVLPPIVEGNTGTSPAYLLNKQRTLVQFGGCGGTSGGTSLTSFAVGGSNGSCPDRQSDTGFTGATGIYSAPNGNTIVGENVSNSFMFYNGANSGSASSTTSGTFFYNLSGTNNTAIGGAGGFGGSGGDGGNTSAGSNAENNSGAGGGGGSSGLGGGNGGGGGVVIHW